MPTIAYLLLGSNLGDRAAHLAQARTALAQTGQLRAASAIYETAAWGFEDQPPYLNQVLALATDLPATGLLAACQQAEQHANRQRVGRWAARTLDVDMLLYGTDIIQTPTLTIPHPALAFRRFTLLPLAELAPDLPHPLLHQTMAELLAACPDPLPVQLWQGE